MITVVVAGLVAGTWLAGRMTALGAHRRGSTQPVSVIVPARNEAVSLPVLLGSLSVLDPAPHEVIVVDDASDDGTATVAVDHRARAITTSPPPGWLGKPWACQLGSWAATGTHLLFLDADTRLAPCALGALIAEHDRRGGLVSVQPYHTTRRPYEELSAYCNVVALLGSGVAANGGRTDAAVAFGPCMLTSVADYERVGGHATVRAEIVEDIELAHRYRAAGLPVTCLRGGRLVQFRMYPGGLRQLVDGWTKNLAAGAASADPVAVAGAVLWIASHTVVAAGLATGLIRWVHRGPVPTPWILASLAVAAHQGWLLRRIGSFRWWTAAAFPVPLLAFLAIFCRSAVLLLAGRDVDWRGRRVRPARVH